VVSCQFGGMNWRDRGAPIPDLPALARNGEVRLISRRLHWRCGCEPWPIYKKFFRPSCIRLRNPGRSTLIIGWIREICWYSRVSFRDEPKPKRGSPRLLETLAALPSKENR